MRKTIGKWKKLDGFFRAFLILAFVFLAVGIGTLGSFRGTGASYELHARRSGDEQVPGVVFRLNNLTEKDENGEDTTTMLALVDVRVNIAAVYAEDGTDASLTLERSTRGETFSSKLTGNIRNHVEKTEEGERVGYTENDFFGDTSLFTFPEDGWRISVYPYVRLSAATENVNVLVNEVVFIGEKLDSSYKGTGEFVVVPARVDRATPYANESADAEATKAEALLDAQSYPKDGQSSFYRFSEEEKNSLSTIAEMRMGREFAADAAGKAVDVYRADNVYGALGTDFLALGTAIFGMSPFGLRIFPMLAAFGALVLLERFTVRLCRSEKAGFVFALVFALGGQALALAHLGTPLMLGVFFFAAALDLCHRFYANGIRRATVTGVLPLLFAGLFGAASMCVHGAFLIPVAGLVALFAAAMVRQQTAKRYALEKAAEPAPESLEGEEEREEPETPEHRAGRVAAEYRFRNIAAPVLYFAGLCIGLLLIGLLSMIPSYFAYLKAFDDPSAPAANVFTLFWRTFANGFTGSNTLGVDASPWAMFYPVFTGAGPLHAVTLAAVSPLAAVAGAAGLGFAVARFAIMLREKEDKKLRRTELRRVVLPFVGFALALVAASFAAGGPLFVLLANVFSYMLAANAYRALSEEEVTKKSAKIFGIVWTVLAAVLFALLAVFLFSVPLPEAFLAKLAF